MRVRKAVVSLICLGLVLTACGRETPPETPRPLDSLWQKNSLSAALRAVVTIDELGRQSRTAVECAVEEVPIAWSGRTFRGRVYQDPDSQAIVSVRGSVSEDGMWIEGLEYSIESVDSVSGAEFEVVLYGVPIAGAADCLSPGQFQRTGDIGKHVKSLSYARGDAVCVAVEWQKSDAEATPTLTINLKKVLRTVVPASNAGCPCEQ
jgi:hypothetical protein